MNPYNLFSLTACRWEAEPCSAVDPLPVVFSINLNLAADAKTQLKGISLGVTATFLGISVSIKALYSK